MEGLQDAMEVDSEYLTPPLRQSGSGKRNRTHLTF